MNPSFIYYRYNNYVYIFFLILGPGLNLFLRKLNFSIGPLKVNKYTAPGVCICYLYGKNDGH